MLSVSARAAAVCCFDLVILDPRPRAPLAAAVPGKKISIFRIGIILNDDGSVGIYAVL